MVTFTCLGVMWGYLGHLGRAAGLYRDNYLSIGFDDIGYDKSFPGFPTLSCQWNTSSSNLSNVDP